MEPIQYIGVSKLRVAEKQRLDELSTEYYPKIKRLLKNITSLVIHIKSYDNEGNRKKFSVHMRAIAPTKMFESRKGTDWDLAKALHKGFKDLEKAIAHKKHSDVSCPNKPRRPQNKRKK